MQASKMQGHRVHHVSTLSTEADNVLHACAALHGEPCSDRLPNWRASRFCSWSRTSDM